LARLGLDAYFEAYLFSDDPTERFVMVWNMRELASAAGELDVLQLLREADACGRRWRNATEPRAAAAHARESRDLVARARELRG